MDTSKDNFRLGRRRFLAASALAFFAFDRRMALADDTVNVGETLVGTPFKGTLYLIGGGADQSLQRFVDIAGGDKAVIAILPHSSGVPQEAADEAANQFTARGVKNLVTIMPNQKVGLPKNVNAVFFTGGDQNRLMRLLDPVLNTEIHDFLKRGGLVGGTSAGAAAAPPRMIAGGMDDKFVKNDSLLLGDGLGYLPGFVVDTHVLQRARHDRLMVALSLIENVTGVGLDEDTAIEIVGKKITVRGEGHARFYQRSDKHSSTLSKVGKGEKASVRNMLYSVLSDGDEWDL
ncbi:MAG: cyanophycinase [Candidatus Melainabacteria bacterium]|mgnify:CR=1 FL=1|nr:cyanophycinase [Candidatus Melainabacteria bacterium]